MSRIVVPYESVLDVESEAPPNMSIGATAPRASVDRFLQEREDQRGTVTMSIGAPVDPNRKFDDWTTLEYAAGEAVKGIGSFFGSVAKGVGSAAGSAAGGFAQGLGLSTPLLIGGGLVLLLVLSRK